MRILWITVLVGLALTSSFMIITLVAIYAASIGIGAGTIGALVSATFIAPLVLAVPVGRRIDRAGVRQNMLIGAVGLALLPYLVVAWPELWALALLKVGTGTAMVFLTISGQASIAALDGGARRLRNLGWFTVAIAVANFVGPLTAGVLADAIGFRAAFAAAGVAAAITAVAVSFMRLPRPLPLPPVPLRSTLAALASSAPVRLGMVASSIVLMALVVNQAFLPVLLTSQGSSATSIGMLLSLVAGASIAVRPFISEITRRLGGITSAIVIFTLIGAFGAVLTGVLPVPTALVIAALALGASAGITQPASMELVLADTDPRDHAAALGLRTSVNRAAQLLGPLVFGAVAVRLGAHTAFVAVGLLTVGVVLVTRWMSAERVVTELGGG